MCFNIKDKEPLWGKWYIGKELGGGAFGNVWEASAGDERCAVKQIDILYSQIDEKKAYIEGITQEGVKHYYKALLNDSLAEINIMQSLSECENIVPLMECEIIEEDKCGWHLLMRMELLQPLDEFLCENKADIKTVLKLGIHICKALEACCSHHIIHRDIKSDNIFYSYRDSSFKLGDFGIAIDLNTPTMINGRPGTLTHMSPEVYSGKDYTFNDDVYALGIILYRLLNFNRLPLMPDYPEVFTPKQRNEAVYNRLKGMKIPLPKLCAPDNESQMNSSDFDAACKLCEAVRRAVSDNVSERYENAEDFRKELELIAELL